ncbi:MAG TPA: hypothetical protein VLV50_00935 [Stellaceae bacterium]|nr:hypothetical protein [Stellaceae bacterium]
MTKWGSLRLGFALSALVIARAAACDLDHAPSSTWSVTRQSGIAWLESPCGERMLAVGVDVVDAGASGKLVPRPHYDWTHFAPSLPAWVGATRGRLAAWGFDSVGAWSLPPQELRIPGAIDLELGRNSKFHWFDPFDPATAARMMSEARRLTAPYRGSPWRIGYFSDNEVGWWSGALFLFFSQKPTENYTKQHWVALLRRLYHDDWTRFTSDFAPPAGVASWDGLLRARAPTRLRPGGGGMRVVSAWTAEIAQHYYELSAKAIHAADPGALYLGDRLPIYYDPAAVRVEAPHVDVISVNYNVDSPEGWIAPYFFDGLRTLSHGKPVLVSEWFYAGVENRSGNRNNGHLMTVATQDLRATGAAAAAANFAALPELVGLQWFQYYDYPQGGRPDHEDYDFGLVDINDQPYEKLTSAFARTNRVLPLLHASARTLARGPFAAPETVIDPAHRSLVDFPKPASLLPPLKATDGGVAFGEAYLAWTRDGLALAHIGQDYYDRDLLAYDGTFPLAEAYRIELGIDAGAGPARFTIYVVPPPREMTKGPMRIAICAGAASLEHATSCAAVPGASAGYYGADQPRVVFDALLPWRALGLDGPPAAGRIRVGLAASSWFRGRTMSLSGKAPAAELREPARWLDVALAPKEG